MKIDPAKVFALLRQKARGACPDAEKAREFLDWMQEMALGTEEPLSGWAKDPHLCRIPPTESDELPEVKLTRLAAKTFSNGYLSELAEGAPLVAEIRITKKGEGKVEGTVHSSLPRQVHLEAFSVVCAPLIDAVAAGPVT